MAQVNTATLNTFLAPIPFLLGERARGVGVGFVGDLGCFVGGVCAGVGVCFPLTCPLSGVCARSVRVVGGGFPCCGCMSVGSGWRSFRFTPTSESRMEPLSIASEAQSVLASVGDGHVVLLAWRDSQGVHNGVLLPHDSSRDVRHQARNVAHAVGASMREEDVPDSVWQAPVVGVLSVPRFRRSLVRQTQAGVDPNAFAKQVVHILSEGEFIAVTMRADRFGERRRNEKYQQHRLASQAPQHHSFVGKPAVMQVIAGGQSRSSVRSVLSQVAGSLPGFDVPTTERIISPLFPAMVAFTVGVVLGVPPSVLVGVFPQVLGVSSWWILFVPALIAFIVGVLFSVGVLSTSRTRILKCLDRGLFPPAPQRLLPPRAPRKSKTDEQGREVDGFSGDYPLHRDAFIVGPHIGIGVASPQSGALSGAAASASVHVPPAVTDPSIGPFIGVGRNGERAHISAHDLFYGVALVGQASSGKSQLLRSLYGWVVCDRVCPSTVEGSTGERSAVVAFESKDDQAEYIAWADMAGDEVVLVNPMDDSSPMINIFDTPGPLHTKAEFAVSCFEYAFEDGSIGNQNRVVLANIFCMSLYIDAHPEIVEAFAQSRPELATDVTPRAGVMAYANVLIGARGDARAQALAEATQGFIRDRRSAGVELDSDEVRIDDTVTATFLAQTETQRRNLFQSSVNKIQQMASLGSWWNPNARATLSWESILLEHRNVVIATGATNNGVALSDRLGDQLSAMLLFSLRNAIRRNCQGWQAAGRSVSIFSDELAVLAGSSSSVFTWLRDQGRAYGVRPFFATQRPDQLDDAVRTTFLNFVVLATFSQSDTTTAREVARSLSGEEGDITESGVKHLAPYEIAVRMSIRKTRQPMFTVTVSNFEADRAGFPREQGWEDFVPGSSRSVPELESSVSDPVERSGADFGSFDDLYDA